MTTGCVIGIDYSVTCPAVCWTDGKQTRWWVNYKLSGKPYVDLPTVQWSISREETEVGRFLELARWVCAIVREITPTHIVLEDYAFSAHGRITQLSENAGVLKAKLYEQFPRIPLHVVAPTTMKKFATGKGIATKDDVWAAFIAREPHTTEWAKLCHPRAIKITSPIADIADAYFLAHYGYIHYLHP